ncbi:VOC family protein [Clostridium folliculivorans]|uniref:VOC family protein n=1 Tax=Clostridium folliculivorans TaxID=2886038 RepID=A0A9W6D9X7_9CLOT|nr:VOC family protein [Clostridium folliculivorans]GKU24242.1 VOC family protein [Clostridium folliculivorans]GKU30347.1 VOC family protein [Clostridium folliculivorans]
MSVKMIHHICIQTEQYTESLDFYTRIIGFEIVSENLNFHGRAYNTWIKFGDFMIELQTPKEGEQFNKWSSLNAGPVHLAFMVDNVEQEYERIKSLGYENFKLKNGQVIYKVLGESLFKIKAPEGTEIEMRDTEITF